MLEFIILLNLLALGISELLDITMANDRMCNPSGLDFGFSGLRVYTSVIYGLPIHHFWTVVKCNKGEIVASQYFPCKRSSNFIFGHPLELDTGEVYIFAREKKYVPREVPIYLIAGKIGAVFSLDKNNNETANYALLEADPFLTSFTQQYATGRRITHIPFMHAPVATDKRGWNARIDVNPYENFNYSASDNSSTWYRINKLLNTASKQTSISEQFLPWEYDSFEKQIQGKSDWRKLINHLVPDLI